MKYLGILMVLAAAKAGAQQQQPPKALPKTEVPAEYRPPKGMCRIWLKDVPPAQQPASTDCASAIKNKPANGTVIFGDAVDQKTKPDIRNDNQKNPPGPVKPPALPPRKPPA